ncbi:glycosyltransferase family 4 protein [Streptomyces sp. NPDC090025]|uniref:glycosyltransferase family 4 protein n=1 Tax=Streptomyces sp. NPDC090025 TaxID=3365922 RepID=UPI003836D454
MTRTPGDPAPGPRRDPSPSASPGPRTVAAAQARTRTGIRTRPRPRTGLLVAVSGPDHTGKSSLVRALAALLRRRGFAVATVHCYGCVLCRWFPVPPRVRDAGEPGGPGRRATRPERRGSWFRRAHGLLDAGELALRLRVARLGLAVVARGRPSVLLTDRGPLDGLVKFDLPPGHGAARRFAALAGRYDLTLLPETRPGTLTGRGWERRTGSPAVWWARHRDWAARLPRVVRLDGERPPAELAERALAQVLGAGPGPVPEPPDDPPRKRVVVSIYDDAENSDYRGGGALVVEKLARRLAAEYDVTVVTAGRSAGSELRGGVRYVRLPVCRAGPRAGQLLFLALLPFAARRIPHDVWLESFTPPFSTSFLPLVSRAPVVGIDQGRSAEALWRRYHVPFFLVERIGLRCYRHIVVLNEADASAVKRLSPHADVQVIANGVEPRQLDDARLGSGDSILFLGRIDAWVKGLDLLLDAYATTRPPMELVLAGSGTAAEERRLAQRLAEFGPGVRWVGYADEELKRRLLRDSAFLVLPSRHETFGLVALEGMSYGKPVLHFDLPALRWMRGGGDVAVPAFDTAAFGERMRALAADPALRRRLGRQAGLAAQHYTWDEMTGRYLALTRRLVEGPARPRRPRKERRVPWQTPQSPR